MKIQLKDGSARNYENPVSVLEVAKELSEGLARVACAGEVDGNIVDLRYVLTKDCTLSILTFEDENGKLAFRHTTSHILAQAVKRLYPNTELAIGPSIENGFYYDFDFKNAFTNENLEAVESEMKKIVKENFTPVQVKILPISEKFSAYSKEVMLKFKSKGIRCEMDQRDEKIGYKIREAQLEKVPYMIILGEKEAESGLLSVRSREQGDIGALSFESVIEHIESDK